MMTCLTSFFKRKSPPVQETVDLDDEVSTVQNSCSYSYKELSIATENFSLENKIGEGGFGRVYKGSLRDGTVVAIKVLSAESRQGMREFLTEIKAIADIEHDNLVKLHGYCAEGNHRILVYGYLENNSLAQTFFSTTSDINFYWPARRMICIGVAKGLAFLHEEVKPYIVHRDIKASNILLDKDLLPKISDFGLAKLFPANMTHISTRVAGTVGYLAPEYAIRGQLTRKADVYSFGVLLLEIVAGRPNTNKRLEPDEQYLLERTWELHEKGELESLVDASIRKDCNIEEACKYLKISLLCTQEKPKLRPSMSTVVKMLTGEISLSDDHKIMKPGLISEFSARGPEGRKGKLDDKNASYNISEGSGGSRPDSYSSSGMETSHAAMTFTSIYYRSS